MPIRTDISEDPKGDPSKIIPNQPEPRLPDEDVGERVEPLLPRRDRSDVAPPPPGKVAQTPGDRTGIARRSREGDKGGKK